MVNYVLGQIRRPVTSVAYLSSEFICNDCRILKGTLSRILFRFRKGQWFCRYDLHRIIQSIISNHSFVISTISLKMSSLVKKIHACTNVGNSKQFLEIRLSCIRILWACPSPLFLNFCHLLTLSWLAKNVITELWVSPYRWKIFVIISHCHTL